MMYAYRTDAVRPSYKAHQISTHIVQVRQFLAHSLYAYRTPLIITMGLVVMSRFLVQATAALRRVESRLRPTEIDVSIICPLLNKLISSDRIPFERKKDGYVIGTEKFAVMAGLDYIRLLLQKPNQPIYCKDLLSLGRNKKPSEGTAEQNIEFRVMEELRTNYAGADVASSYQEALDDEAISALKDRITTLEDAMSIEELEELDFLKEFLDQNTYRGDSHKLKSEKERARQAVSQAINYAIKKLKANKETTDIAIHLDENIKRGTDCLYFGVWKWKF